VEKPRTEKAEILAAEIFVLYLGIIENIQNPFAGFWIFFP
jgi:hypothetical protein